MKSPGLLCGFTLALLLSGCAHVHPCRLFEADHLIEGAWQATDKTVFIFRHDGTFHGVDYRSREIWGSWVKLSDNRVGFHSLLYDRSYSPQYAVVDPEDRNHMDYIMTGKIKFIETHRMKLADAESFVAQAVSASVVMPGDKPPFPTNE
jgi:hypothetical protein